VRRSVISFSNLLAKRPYLVFLAELDHRVFGRRHPAAHHDDQQVIDDVGLSARRALAEGFF
jgi:hypothetical protein